LNGQGRSGEPNFLGKPADDSDGIFFRTKSLICALRIIWKLRNQYIIPILTSFIESKKRCLAKISKWKKKEVFPQKIGKF
jgi:hypothetical protein